MTIRTNWTRLARTTFLVSTVVVLQGQFAFTVSANDGGNQPTQAVVDDARIIQLIEQLGDDNYHVRVNASWELSRIGLPAFGQLRRATEHPNIQIANAARYIVQSQNVTWWLDTDSAEVRRQLADYNKLNEVDRETRMQRLAEIESDDALLALARLARFESNDRLSKSAAMYLMETLASIETQPTLTRSIQVTIGDDQRTATDWLRQLCRELGDSKSDVAAWQSYTESEARDSAELREALRGRRPTAEANAGALRLYRWVGQWLTDRNGRDQAMEIAKQALELVPQSAHGYQEFSKWAVAADLAELVVALAAKHPEPFQKEPRLGFMLAEAYRKVGDETAAEQTALVASNLIGELTKNLHIPSSVNINDLIANHRRSLAVHLVSRGLFDWAEREYTQALASPTSPVIEAELRNFLAEFYWTGGEFDKAAEALRPLHESQINKNAEQGLPGPTSPLANVAPNYYFYAGLAAIKRGEFDSASDLLVKAIESEALGARQANPDVVIAMQQIANTSERQAIFESYLETLVQDYQREIVNDERVLAESTDRRSRAYTGAGLASHCNQLAWLLSKCGIEGEEAVHLSRRSLEFQPNEPTYLDTFARCLFAAGRLEEAVEYQRQALEHSPHDRQMKAQLDEFEAALAARSAAE